ncbi:rod shape-determining protein MreC [Candidatus Pelagibacter sp.]|nr:rod shape-determining protein MreC [Candidatus Pelagibacter sp.]MDA9631515.1 rod shape-determining protein MreC [Candidatus Pelagibacter sp.]
MVTVRDDFVIAVRSAFLKKKDKQKFSLLTLLFLSIFVIILSNFNFKIIKIIKVGINEAVYRSSFLISIPENKIKKINSKIENHMKIYDDHKKILSELENLKQKKLSNEFLKLENEKLRKLINEGIKSDEILAKVIIDKKSPFLKTIVLNKGSKDNVKIGMGIMDGVYLVGKVIEVNYTNSRALLLNDLNSKIAVLLLPSRIQAVASGSGKNHGKIEYTKDEYEDEIDTKDRIVYTSGLAGIFKSGIPIGRISSNSNNRIDFFSDFTQLDYVKIISYNIKGIN